MQWAQLGIERWVAVAATVVIFDDIFESGDAAIVHVRRGAGDLAQGRRFEFALTCAGIREFAVPAGDAAVVQAFAGEVWTDVQATQLAAVDEAVEGRIAGENGPTKLASAREISSGGRRTRRQ